MSPLKRVTDHETSNYVECYEVSSHSNPDRSYVVSKNRRGTWACSCPRWIFQKGHREDCKHINEVLYALSVSARSNVKIQETPITDKIRKALSRFAMIETE